MEPKIEFLLTGERSKSEDLFNILKNCISKLTEVESFEWKKEKSDLISEELVKYWSSGDVLQFPVVLLEFANAELNACLYFEKKCFVFNPRDIKSLKFIYMTPARGAGQFVFMLGGASGKSSNYEQLAWAINDATALSLIQATTKLTAALNWQFSFDMASDV